MSKVKLSLFGVIIALSAVLITACATDTPDSSETTSPLTTTQAENRAIITDRTGRSWDVTHARDVYGMNPDYFNYGLGFGAISSVDSPRIFTEGDPGHPDPDKSLQVFGVNHNGEQRAYDILALIRHEVFNDVFPGESDQYVAVTY